MLTKDDIRNFVYPWYPSNGIGSDLTPVNQQTQEQDYTSDDGQACKMRVFDFQNPTPDLMNSDVNLDVLYPGGFVQNKYVSTGAESLVKLPISHSKRYPIRIASEGNFAPVWSNSSEAGDVHYTIKQAL